MKAIVAIMVHIIVFVPADQAQDSLYKAAVDLL